VNVGNSNVAGGTDGGRDGDHDPFHFGGGLGAKGIGYLKVVEGVGWGEGQVCLGGGNGILSRFWRGRCRGVQEVGGGPGCSSGIARGGEGESPGGRGGNDGDGGGQGC